MDLKFGNAAKELRNAVNRGDLRALVCMYKAEHVELILSALEILRAARNLNDVMLFHQFRPHALTGDKADIFSMSVGGRKRLIVKTLGANGKPTKRVDFTSGYGLIVEVSEHYGD